MSGVVKALQTLLVGYNVILTLLVIIVTGGLLVGGVTAGPPWLVLLAPFSGWFAWSLIREDLDDIRAIWGDSHGDDGRA